MLKSLYLQTVTMTDALHRQVELLHTKQIQPVDWRNADKYRQMEARHSIEQQQQREQLASINRLQLGDKLNSPRFMLNTSSARERTK